MTRPDLETLNRRQRR